MKGKLNIHQFIYNERYKYLDICFEDVGLVYVFFNPITKLFKIGKTSRYPKERLRELSRQNGVELINYASAWMEGSDHESPRWVESALHFYFKDKRVIGEWFNLSKYDAVRLTLLFESQFETHDNYLWDNLNNIRYTEKL